MQKNQITNPLENPIINSLIIGKTYIRTFFEDIMLKLALKSKEDSKNSKNELDETKHCIGAVIFSWCFLESYINNFINNELKQFKTEMVPDDFLRLSTIQKYVFIPRIISGKSFSKEKEPYSSLVLLNKIRNDLIHYDAKMEEYYTYLTPKKFEKRCKEKFTTKEIMGTGTLRRILSKGCADWSVRTAIRTVEKFEEFIYEKKYHTFLVKDAIESLDDKKH